MTIDVPAAGRAGLQWMSPDRLDQLHPPLSPDMTLGEHWGPSYRQHVTYRPTAGRDQGVLVATDPLWNESAVLCEKISFETANHAVESAVANFGHHGISVDILALLARGAADRACVRSTTSSVIDPSPQGVEL